MTESSHSTRFDLIGRSSGVRAPFIFINCCVLLAPSERRNRIHEPLIRGRHGPRCLVLLNRMIATVTLHGRSNAVSFVAAARVKEANKILGHNDPRRDISCLLNGC